MPGRCEPNVDTIGHHHAGGHKALSESALQTSGEDSDPVKVEQEEEEEQPARKGPGRKKRTTPILVETEDGETKYVTPAEFRKLRRWAA